MIVVAETLETCREVVLSRSVHQETCFQVDVMAASAPFFQEAFVVCPSGLVPDVKFQQALKDEHAKKHIYFSDSAIEIWVTVASEAVRQVARYFRMVNDQTEDELKRTWKKALGMNLLQKNGYSDLEGACGRGGGGRVALSMSLGLS